MPLPKRIWKGHFKILEGHRGLETASPTGVEGAISPLKIAWGSEQRNISLVFLVKNWTRNMGVCYYAIYDYRTKNQSTASRIEPATIRLQKCKLRASRFPAGQHSDVGDRRSMGLVVAAQGRASLMDLIPRKIERSLYKWRLRKSYSKRYHPRTHRMMALAEFLFYLTITLVLGYSLILGALAIIN